MIAATGAEPAIVTVNRNGVEMDISAQKALIDGSYKAGIELETVWIHMPFFTAIGKAFELLWMMITGIFQVLGDLISGNSDVAGSLMGPVGVVNTLTQQAKASFVSLLSLLAMISANLGVVNLLPLPAMDGGRIIFLLIEAVRGKPVSPDKEGMVHLVGLGLFLMLAVLLTFNDIKMILGG